MSTVEGSWSRGLMLAYPFAGLDALARNHGVHDAVHSYNAVRVRPNPRRAQAARRYRDEEEAVRRLAHPIVPGDQLRPLFSRA